MQQGNKCGFYVGRRGNNHDCDTFFAEAIDPNYSVTSPENVEGDVTSPQNENVEVDRWVLGRVKNRQFWEK